MRDKESGIAVIAAIALMALIAVCMLSSCATKKKVLEVQIEKEYVHDTVYSHSVDTVVKERVVHKTDTVRNTENQVITLIQREPGRVDTLRVDTNKEIYHSSELVDSTRRLHIAVDSLLKVLDKQHHEEQSKEVVKQPVTFPWKWLCMGLLCVMAMMIVIRAKT